MPVPLYIMNDDGVLVPWDGKVEVVDKLKIGASERGRVRKAVSAINWVQVVIILLLLAILVSLWAR